MTDATPNPPTGSGKLIWRKPLTRDVVDCAQFAKFEARPIMPAPERDMRITREEWDA
ncbi:MAG: hypothetical protein WAS34_14575 [Thiolinea sp.]